MTEDQESKDSPDSGSKTFVNKSKDKKSRPPKPPTKIILRRLPPTMTMECFLEQVSPIPEHDYLYLARPDPTLGNNVYSRAYINFINEEDIYIFRDKFDGYIFLDEKGVEYVGVVEYAPFQRIPRKKKKKDPKCGTIESDPIYQEFVESLNKDPEQESQPKLEYSYPVNDGNDKKVQTTPLLEYLIARKQDRRGRDERRRRENDKKKMRNERKIKDPIKEEEGEIEVKKIKSRDWEKDKSKSKDDKDGSVFESKSYKDKSSDKFDKKKKYDDKKDEEPTDDGDKSGRKDKSKDMPREQKGKKYSDTRKERAKLVETLKAEKSAFSKTSDKSDSKPKLPNHEDIKPFTQLPHVKTDDLTKIIEEMDKKMKMKDSKEKSTSRDEEGSKLRRDSVESGEPSSRESPDLKHQHSLEDRSKSSEREDSEEKSDGASRRAERRIRNKDRPSLVIYQPGMGKFSKQRITKDTRTPKSVTDSEKKDT